jgi:cysteine desulfurase
VAASNQNQEAKSKHNSMAERTYLDWNATAPLREEARRAFADALGAIGNPSSVHAEGRAARRLIEQARAQVAKLVGAAPANVIFTSGGTEANALALTPFIETATEKAPRGALLISSIEHPSVRAGGRFAAEAITELPVEPDGRLKLAALAEALANVDRPLVSLMLANNETGVIQPVAEAAALVHAAGGLLHVDAVQGVARTACDINALGADLMTLSAHKIGGPKGVGALIRGDDLHFADPLIRGGGQERGARGGTENVPGIAAFGAAAAAAHAHMSRETSRMSALRQKLEQGLYAVAPDTVVFGVGVPRLPNTTLFAVPGVKAETAIIGLDLEGIAVSSGAACSSGKVQASHVLEAMGFGPPLTQAALRVSVGWTTTEADVERFQNAWRKAYGALSKGLTDKRGFAA